LSTPGFATAGNLDENHLLRFSTSSGISSRNLLQIWGNCQLGSALSAMDQLQVTSSITGIIAAATQVSNLLGQIKDAPASIIAVLTEVDHIKNNFLALQRFLDKATRLSGGRAALIQLEDVVVVLTRTVLVFSDLESLVSPISNGKKTSYPARLTWTRIQGRVMRLVNQLQRHKISLTLLLQIVQW
jgi:hypothetical protein